MFEGSSYVEYYAGNKIQIVVIFYAQYYCCTLVARTEKVKEKYNTN